MSATSTAAVANPGLNTRELSTTQPIEDVEVDATAVTHPEAAPFESATAPFGRVDGANVDSSDTSVATGRHVDPFQRRMRVSGMQRWEGRILEISDGIFTAELIAIDNSTEPILADFSLSSLGYDDSVLAHAGDMVYVTVRTVQSAGSGPTLTSAVRLRKLGHWTTDELDRIDRVTEEKTRRLARLID